MYLNVKRPFGDGSTRLEWGDEPQVASCGGVTNRHECAWEFWTIPDLGPIPDLFFERLTCTGDYRSTGAIFDFRMIWRLAPWRPQFYCTRQIWRLLHCVCPKLDRNIAETQNSSRSETDGSGPFILRETVCTVPTSHGMCQSLASRWDCPSDHHKAYSWNPSIADQQVSWLG